MGELQQLLPSLSATVAFALCLVFVTRQEEGYVWWKAILIPIAGALLLLGFELIEGIIPIEAVRIAVAWFSIFAVIGGVSLLARNLLQMSWRDAALVGVAYAVAQAAVFFAQIYFSTHPLPIPS
jgi:membrane-bound ClpP family serine protease